MNTTRRRGLMRILTLFSVIFPLVLGALGMYIVEEARYRDLQEPAAAGAPAAEGISAAEEQARATFDQVAAYLDQDSYYRPLDKAALWYGAATGMAKAAGDQWTTLISPAANQLFEEDLQGHVEGLGMFITTSTGELTVQEPLPGSPAERAGLRKHDKIKQINGNETTGVTANDASDRIRGPVGSVVRLTIQRNYDPPFDVDIVREHVEIPACRTTIRPDTIAVIRCWTFGEKTLTDLDAGLNQAIAANARALVLDLRSNSGGYTQGAQELLGRFLSPSVGPAFYKAHYKGDFNPEAIPILAPPAGAPHWYDKPLVLIMNGDTASASEIVAAALQDYKRAKLVGTHTNGKGSEQNYYKLDDGSGLFITDIHWLTPNKQDINKLPYVPPNPAVTPSPLPMFTPTPLPGVPTLPPELTALHSHYGVQPDFAILSTPDDDLHDRDPEMDRTVKYLLTGK